MTRPELSVGMATFADFHGVYFTVQSLRLHHAREMRQCEILVVDNDPDGAEGKMVKELLGWLRADCAIDDQELVNRMGAVPGLGPIGYEYRFAFLDSIQNGLASPGYVRDTARTFASYWRFPREGDHIQQFADWCVRGLWGVQYVPYTEAVGTSAPRDQVFKMAQGKAVLCLDSHVLLADGAIQALLRYYRDHPGTRDLLSGPLLMDDLRNLSTHFDDIWRGEMWGTWGTDRAALARGEPFEIGAMGLGAFSMRKDTWPGFNPAFRGFGGEEWYLHEKVRRAGGKCICLPELKWLHRFGRPGGVKYPLNLWNKVRNYVIGHQELGLSLDRVYQEFVAPRLVEENGAQVVKPGLMPEHEWQQVVSGADWPQGYAPPSPSPFSFLPAPGERDAKPGPCGGCQQAGTIQEALDLAARNPSDLNEHVHALRDLAAKCDHVTALGGRHRVSTVALLAGMPEKVVVVDPQASHEIPALLSLKGRPELVHVPRPTLDVDLEETDLLFIDTRHTAEHLYQELSRHAPQVRKWIVLHDTVIYGEKGEDGGPGLLPAVRRYLGEHPEWTVRTHWRHQYGLLMLTRDPRDKKKVPPLWEQGWNALKASWRAGDNVLKGFGPLVDTPAYTRRLELCTLCESRVETRCSECGCGVEKKASWATEFCPLGQWVAEEVPR